MESRRYGSSFILKPPCMLLRNLPDGTKGSKIQAFLKKLNIEPYVVHTLMDPYKMYHPMNLSIGAEANFALVQFDCYCDLNRALSLNGTLMNNQPVYLQAISYEDLCKIVDPRGSPPRSTSSYPIAAENVCACMKGTVYW